MIIIVFYIGQCHPESASWNSQSWFVLKVGANEDIV